MKKIIVLVCALVAAACAAPPTNREIATTNTNLAAESKSAAITEADATAKEKAAWEAIKNKDYDAFANMLASDQVEISPEGINDKAASIANIKEFEPTEVTFADWKFLALDKDAFVVTYTANVKGKYKGKEFPPESVRASSAWVNRDGKWLAIYHQECPIKPPMPPAPTTKSSPAKSSASPMTTPMAAMGSDPVANEKMVWEALKNKNYDASAAMLDPQSIEVEPDGVFDKAGSVKGVSQFDFSKAVLSDWKTVKLDDDASLVAYMVKIPGGAPEGERHATLWASREGKWLAVFHQGTPVMKAPAGAAPMMAASPAAKPTATK